MSANKIETPPLSLYVHVPWCIRKCPYCDFNSHKSPEQLPEQAYVDALIEDLKESAPLAQGRKLESIFIGGGTPSLFSADAFSQLLEATEKQLGFSDDIEITLEANPGTAEQQRFQGYRQAGINRLSIGIQSFEASKLQSLGRIHDAQQARNAALLAKDAGFDNFNLDLMHGLPQQSAEQALSDLQTAIDLGPSHLSWYQLTIEPNTEFYKKTPTLPLDDELAEIQQQGQSLLSEAGFEQYEVSAYSRKRPSQHNLNYWQFGDYLGIGAGAHGKITLEDGNIQRHWKTRQPEHYLDPKRQYTAGSENIEQSQLALEFMMNALRLNQGFELSLFNRRTGLDLDQIKPTLHQLKSQGLIELDEYRMQPSPLGQRFLNNVVAAFLDQD